MAIVTRKACKCALCYHEWLATHSRNNPQGDPRKVSRCASCKSTYWNSDDPKVIQAREAKKVTSNQGASDGIHADLAGIPTQPAATVEFGSRLLTISKTQHFSTCRHRVLLSHCTLCNPPQAASV